MTGLSSWRLWRDLRRFRRAGILGLIDRRTLPHPRGRPPIDARLPQHIRQHIVRLALAHPFTARELARIVRECDHQPIDYRGIQRVLAQPRRSPIAVQRRHQVAPQAPLPSSAPTPQLALPLEPHTLAQRLALALGPEHLLLRFRPDGEYPTGEQARWRVIASLEVGFRPRRVAKLLAIQPPVVYHGKRRLATAGLLGLTTRTRARTPRATRMPVQAMMDVFQLLDNHPLLGHYRVKMALDSLG
jgi:hypothetical protein